MANTVNTFVLKLEKGDFENQLKDASKANHVAYKQMANSVSQANKAQLELNDIYDKRNKALKQNEFASEKEKKSIASIKKLYNEQIQQQKLLIQTENQKQAGIRKNIQYQNESISILNKEIDGARKSTQTIDEKKKSTNNLTNAVVRHLRQIETLVVAYYTLSKGFKATIGHGIEINKIIESNTYGMAALTSANTQMVDSLGNTLTPMQKFVMAQKNAKDNIAEIRKESIKTSATFPQLLEIFQQATGHTLKAGHAMGATVAEIDKNTIKLASRMSNIGGSIGMEMQKVKEEIRSLIGATASTDSTIATMIFGSPTEANKAVREAAGRAGGLVDLFNERFAAFDLLADTKTFSKSVLEIQNAWSIAMGDMVEKSGAFKDITELFYDLSKDITENTNDIVEGFDNFYNKAKYTIDMLAEPAGLIATIYLARTAVLALNTAIRANPLVMLASGVVLASEATKEYIETMQRGGKTSSEFNKLIKENQEKYNSVEETKKRITANREEVEQRIQGIKTTISVLEKQGIETSKHKEILKSLNGELIQHKAAQESIDKLSEQSDKISKVKEEASLVARINEDIKAREASEKRINKGASTLIALEKERLVVAQNLLSNEAKLSSAKKTSRDSETESMKRLNKMIARDKEALKLFDDDIEKERKKIDEAKTRENNREYKDALKQREIKNSILVLDKQLSGEIVTRSEVLAEELNLLGEEISLSENKYLAIEKYKTKELELQKQIKKEKEDQEKADYDTIQSIEKEFADKEKEVARQLKDAIKEIENQTITFDIKLNGFDDLTNGIAGIVNGFTGAIDASAKYNKQIKILEKEQMSLVKGTDAYNKKTEEGKKLTAQNASAQVGMYASMTGAMANFYDEDDDRRKRQLEVQKVMQTAQMAMQIAQMTQSTAFTSLFVAQEATKATAAGATAVAVAAQSSPWTGIATAAAMIAMLASVGVMFTSKSTSQSFDAISGMKANEGKGSVLGDPEAQSESISNSLSILEDYAKPEFALMSQMTKSLKSIEQNIGGLTGNLIKQGGFAFGEGYTRPEFSSITGTFDKAYDNTIGKFSTLFLNLDKLLIQSPIGKVLGGLFGKTSQSLTDAGLLFGDQLLPQATTNLQGQSYQAITTTKKSWLKKSSSTATRLQGLDSETEKQFQLVLSNLYDTTLLAGQGLGASTSSIENELSDFVVRLGKISLKGKSGEQIQETLTSIFGKIGDDIARDAFPALDPFQKVGEGLFETMTRVSAGIQESEFYIDRLGNAFDNINYLQIQDKQGDVALEALTQSVINFEKATYGADSSLISIIDSLSGTTQEAFDVYSSLDSLRDRLKFLKQDIQGLTSSMLLGAGGIDALQDGFTSYFENFLTEAEQLAYETQAITKEFNKLGITLPISKDGFTDIINSLDLSTESGQELYGRLMLLAEGFASVSDSVEASIQTLEEELESMLETAFNPLITTLDKMFNRITSMADSAMNTINGITGKNRSEFENLVEYNKLKADFAANKDEKTFSSILGLSQTIAEDSSYSKDILGYLENQITQFDKDKDILKVTLVDALGANLGLSTDQKGQLQMAIADGVLTEDEIKGMSLSESQKQALVTTADNSAMFSTEDTLSALNLLAKKQLQAMTVTQEDETVGLSAKTFEYGDYIGKQEQIDIAKTLGVSYETAQPLVEQLQNLSISTDKQGDVDKLLGFTAGSRGYNKNIAEQIKLLGVDNIGSEVINNIGRVESSALANISSFEKEKSNLVSALSMYQGMLTDAIPQTLYIGQTNDQLWESILKSNWDSHVAQYGIGWDTGLTSDAERANQLAVMQKQYTDREYALYVPRINELSNQIDNLNSVYPLGFSSGGYTGAGGKYDPAGMVHKGEVVWSQNDILRHGGVGNVEAMRRSNNTSQNISMNMDSTNNILISLSKVVVQLAQNTEQQTRIQGASLDALESMLVELEGA